MAQTTTIRGRVLDAVTGEPLPFVPVAFQGSYVGTVTDDAGRFSFTSNRGDTVLVCRYTGYRPVQVSVKLGQVNEVELRLQPESREIEAVVVHRDEGPAYRLLDSVLAHKARNRPSHLPHYQCDIYTKQQIEFNTKGLITDEQVQANAELASMLDSNHTAGAAYIPVLISETLSQFYYRQSPKLHREVIQASHISGLDEPSWSQFLGKYYFDFDLYDNNLELVNVAIPTPLNDNARLFYRYYLVDSVPQHGRATYQLSFRPRESSTPSLYGQLSIDSVTYAVQSFTAQMPVRANVNYITSLALQGSYSCHYDSVWLPDSMQTTLGLAPLLLRKYVVYSLFDLSSPTPKAIARATTPVLLSDTVDALPDSLWARLRPRPLRRREQLAYRLTDSAMRAPGSRIFHWLYQFCTSFYIPAGYVDIGPVTQLYSYNAIEGHRFRLGLRTSDKLSGHFYVGGYAAYGTGDRAFKWGGMTGVLFSKSPWRALDFEYYHDYRLLGSASENLAYDDIFQFLTSRGQSRYLAMLDVFRLSTYVECIQGLDVWAETSWRKIHASAALPLLVPGGDTVQHIVDASLSLGIQWQKDVQYIILNRQRLPTLTPYPAISFSVSGAHKGVAMADHTYLKLYSSIDYKLQLRQLGYSKMSLSGGIFFGELPLPLQELHSGSGSYILSPNSFNMMSYLEFVSDRWVQFTIYHHFMGILFNRIPGIKRLSPRGVIGAKLLYGHSTLANRRLIPLELEVKEFGHIPYVEASVGIENIFQLLRVDLVWRATHEPDWKKSLGVRGGIFVQF